jgi:hypothetical protein
MTERTRPAVELSNQKWACPRGRFVRLTVCPVGEGGFRRRQSLTARERSGGSLARNQYQIAVSDCGSRIAKRA